MSQELLAAKARLAQKKRKGVKQRLLKRQPSKAIVQFGHQSQKKMDHGSADAGGGPSMVSTLSSVDKSNKESLIVTDELGGDLAAVRKTKICVKRGGTRE